MKTLVTFFISFFVFSSGVLAADIDGTWEGTMPGSDGNPMDIIYEFVSEGENLNGLVSTKSGDGPFFGGKIEGNNISFSVEIPGTTVYINGTLSGDVINMTQKKGDNVTKFTLKRVTQGNDAADITGIWTPSMSTNTMFTFKIYRNTNGSLSSTMDYPRQGSNNIPVDKTEFKSGKLHLEVKRINLSFDGVINAEGTEIFGRTKQGGRTRPMILIKTGKTKEININSDFLTEIIEKYNLPALAYAVVKDGKIIKAEAKGKRNMNEDVQVTINDKFHIGSCTKSITATLAAILVQENALSWNTTISEVFPTENIHEDFKNVTLEQLLRHTAGLHRDDKILDWPGYSKINKSPSDARLFLIRKSLQKEAIYKPGTRNAYSNIGYAIAAALLEKSAGQTYETLLFEKLFKKLKLSSFGFGQAGTEGKNDQPSGHNKNHVPYYGDDPLVYNSAGGLHCSITDFAEYVIFHLNGHKSGTKILKKEFFQRLHKPSSGSGLAVREEDWAKGISLNAGGSNGFNCAHMHLAPEIDFGLVIMTNIFNREACNELKDILIKKYL